MPTKPPLRLASVQDPGASLYNSYHFLTQISGLYAQGQDFDHHALAKTAWLELSEMVLGDLGDLFLAWETVLNQGKSGAPIPADLKLGETIARACRRADAVLSRLNVWTPVQRLALITQLCERRWQRILAALAAGDPQLKTPLAKIRSSSLERSGRLTGLIEKYSQEETRLRQSLAIANSASSKSGSGF